MILSPHDSKNKLLLLSCSMRCSSLGTRPRHLGNKMGHATPKVTLPAATRHNISDLIATRWPPPSQKPGNKVMDSAELIGDGYVFASKKGGAVKGAFFFSLRLGNLELGKFQTPNVSVIGIHVYIDLSRSYHPHDENFSHQPLSLFINLGTD